AMVPAEEVGGDYYDLLQTPHGEAWLGVGDVSGHGVESGLVMMMAQTSIATLVNTTAGRTPSEVLVHANQVIRENVSRLGTHRYMTVNVMRLDEGRVVIAGKHQDLFVWRSRTREVERVSNEGAWLGVVDDLRGAVEDQALALEIGDWLLLHTDGLTEATDARGEMFGEARLRQALADVAGVSPLREAVQQILGRVQQHQHRQDDDLTLVLVRRTR
ncbi:MAG TPA: SpoIIE family protein phosphatase, partial [Archangium sp.]